MKKIAVLTGLAAVWAFVFSAHAQETAVPASAGAENVQTEAAAPEEILTRKERERLEKQQRVAAERAQVTSRFKRKAIERAEEREKRQLELQKEREEKASRFQKAAMEEDARKVAEEKGLIEKSTEGKSRFTLKAEQRAAERARKEQEKLDRRNRR